jgi:hypothetical protein
MLVLDFGQSVSPFDRMFGSGLFDNLFHSIDDFEDFSSRLGYPLPRHREAVDIDQYSAR